jgi:hypothetical protein
VVLVTSTPSPVAIGAVIGGNDVTALSDVVHKRGVSLTRIAVCDIALMSSLRDA